MLCLEDEIASYKCKVVFTHFLGRPLGRFSPVASAFCKNKDT